MLANVEWAVATFDLVPEDRVSNVTSHHFDLSWLELFATIAVGATLVQLRENTVKFPADLAAAMEAAGLTVWCSVPSILVGLVERGQLERRDLSSLRQVCFAGERFPAKHLRRLMELVPSPRYTNMYGTSETHIAAYHHLTELPEADQLLPIGRACEHVNLCAVRPDGTPCAPGESGELVIRGPSVMEGYWHLPERNELALAPVAVTALGPARCYHAGDLVIERTGGVFEILGRADRRIKVQGSLVDLDEVERVLFTQPAVLEAATYQVNPNDESAGVGASLVARPGETITEADVRAHAAALLPTHAVPVSVKIEQALPKNASGKLDRRALQDQATATPVSRARRAVEPGDPVRAFLLEELVDADVASILADDMELVSSGLLGSLGVFALVEFLGEELDIHVDDRDITEENFRSLAAIRALLARLAPRG
jgi:acyl-coenzyme A synthetase/AMP-(fatty) acid ligase/acyl carrier protein